MTKTVAEAYADYKRALAALKMAEHELMRATGQNTLYAAKLAAAFDVPGFNGQSFSNFDFSNQGAKKQPFNSMEELNEALRKQRQANPPKPKPTPAERIHQIEEELDIIRGIKPTPKGYSIDKTKIKKLVRELQQLRS